MSNVPPLSMWMPIDMAESTHGYLWFIVCLYWPRLSKKLFIKYGHFWVLDLDISLNLLILRIIQNMVQILYVLFAGYCESLWEFKSKWTNQRKGLWKAESLCGRSGKNKTQRKMTISYYIVHNIYVYNTSTILCVHHMHIWGLLVFKGKDFTTKFLVSFLILITHNTVKY